MTKERPILFSGAMVRAILDVRKTQTRRIVKYRNEHPPAWATYGEQLSQLKYDLSRWIPSGIFMWSEEQTPGEPMKPLRRWPCASEESELPGPFAIPCPYGKPGDRLWVRETWGYNPDFPGMDSRACYRADPGHEYDGIKWKPSIHMPRAACRLMLEITGVRVERLHDCSETDAAAEGALPICAGAAPCIDQQARHYGEEPTAVSAFASLWNSINGAGAWADNPWVWVIEFRRVA